MPAGSFPEQAGCSPCPARRTVRDASPCIRAGPGRRSRIPFTTSKMRSRAHSEPCPVLEAEGSSFTSTLPWLPATSSLSLHTAFLLLPFLLPP